ncbi:MAG: hypothetical protein POELPBGB_01347 [Bacteroidia bacterium]|nr:hypothetical protein [Bacteroidia bacterium]
MINKHKIIRIIYLFISSIISFSCNSGTPSPKNAGDKNEMENHKDSVNHVTKYALLIGINTYELVKDLNGCENDVDLMKNLLKTKFDFKEENIRVIKSEQATQENILTAFKSHLIDQIDSNDIVVFHYSGHGGRIKNLNSEEIKEADKYEEFLVPYDYNPSSSSDFKGILDDQINELLLTVADITKNVTFIFDACHSGGSIKSIETVRRIEDQVRALPKPDKSIKLIKSMRNDGSKYVFIAGCKSNQYSYETEYNGKSFGSLTYHLVNELNKQIGKITYGNIMKIVRQRVQAQHQMNQYPEIYGANENYAFFGDEVLHTEAYLLVKEISKDTITIEGGRVIGITKNSEFAIYDPLELKLDDISKSVATIKIVEVKDFYSKAILLKGNISKVFSKAVEISHVFSDLQIKLFYSGNWNSFGKIKEEVNKLPYIATSLNINEADIVLKEKNGNIMLTLPWDTSEAKLTLNDVTKVEELKSEINKWAKWYSAIALHNSSSKLDIDIDIYKADAKGGKALLPSISKSFQEEDQIVLKITNNSSLPVYIYLLNIIDNGEVIILNTADLPDLNSELIDKGQTVSQQFILKLSEDQGDQGVEVYKVYASTTGIDLTHLEKDKTKAGIPMSSKIQDWVTEEVTIRVSKK